MKLTIKTDDDVKKNERRLEPGQKRTRAKQRFPVNLFDFVKSKLPAI